MKKKTRSISEIVLSFIPYIIYVLVIFPILGRITFNLYESYALTSIKMTNTIVTLILILANVLVLLCILYAFNLMTKFDMKKYLLVGGTIFIYTLTMALIKYNAYVPVKVVSNETATSESFLRLNEFKTARGIFIAFAVYFIVSILINRIAVISIKNKKEKSSR